MVDLKIKIGPDGNGTVILNGQDLSMHSRNVQLDHRAGEPLYVTLTLRPDDLELELDGRVTLKFGPPAPSPPEVPSG